jgi:hypothetical protein
MLKQFYDPYDWYWKDDAGRIYGSKSQRIVTESDADFVAWQGDDPKAQPQNWPRDDAGEQTNESLQEQVLDQYGFTIPAQTSREAKRK